MKLARLSSSSPGETTQCQILLGKLRLPKQDIFAEEAKRSRHRHDANANHGERLQVLEPNE